MGGNVEGGEEELCLNVLVDVVQARHVRGAVAHDEVRWLAYVHMCATPGTCHHDKSGISAQHGRRMSVRPQAGGGRTLLPNPRNGGGTVRTHPPTQPTQRWWHGATPGWEGRTLLPNPRNGGGTVRTHSPTQPTQRWWHGADAV